MRRRVLPGTAGFLAPDPALVNRKRPIGFREAVVYFFACRIDGGIRRCIVPIPGQARVRFHFV